MHRLHLSPAAQLRRTSFVVVVLLACARVLRRMATWRLGIPTAFVSLSGVTAMLATAVRMA